MYPFVRALSAILRGRRTRPPKAFDLYAPFETHHRAWPLDVDIFGELNNGRILTLCELARWEMTSQAGLLSVVAKNRLAFAVAGVSVHYRRRIPIWSRYRIRTQFLGYDDKFMYFDHSMWMDDTACNQVLLRAAFTKNRKLLPPGEALALWGVEVPTRPLPDWATRWIEADATRPWPPAV